MDQYTKCMKGSTHCLGDKQGFGICIFLLFNQYTRLPIFLLRETYQSTLVLETTILHENNYAKYCAK